MWQFKLFWFNLLKKCDYIRKQNKITNTDQSWWGNIIISTVLFYFGGFRLPFYVHSLFFLHRTSTHKWETTNGGPRPSIFELELPLSDIYVNHSNYRFELRKIKFFLSNRCHSTEVLVKILRAFVPHWVTWTLLVTIIGWGQKWREKVGRWDLHGEVTLLYSYIY